MSANAQKGEVSFAAGGETYILVFSIDAMCVCETLLDKEWAKICGLIAANRLTAVRAALWAGLRQHHPKVTLKAAGDLIPLLELPAMTLLANAIKAAMPDAEEGAGKSEKGPPAPPAAASASDGEISSQAGAS